MPVLHNAGPENLLVLVFTERGVVGVFHCCALGQDLVDGALYHFGLGDYTFEDVVSHEVHVQGETVGSWVADRRVACDHAVFRTHWVTNATCETLCKDLSISEHYPALTVNIILRIRDFLTELKPPAVSVLDLNRLGLIATRPYDQVSPLHIFTLLLDSPRLYKSDPFLLSPHDLEV